MPSLDHVRVVRMLVKQVHSFVYAKTTDLNQLPILHPSDELRRYNIFMDTSIVIRGILTERLCSSFRAANNSWTSDTGHPQFANV